MKSYCEDCGCAVYDGRCTNCHEVLYIEDKYYELDMVVPESLSNECKEAREDIERKKMIKDTI